MTVPRARHTTAPPGVRLHRIDLAAHDVRDGTTSPERTVLDCATTLPRADALAVADGVLRGGLLSPAELVAAASGTRVRAEPQFRVPGTPNVVDLADPRLRIVLEADSFTHHGTRAGLREDCRRYDELVRLRWTVLRFAWEHVMSDQAWVAEVVSDCCRRA